MHKQRTLWLVSFSLALAVAVGTLQGCGGGGGPLVRPPDIGAPPSTRFTELLPQEQKNASYVGTESCLPCHGAGHRQAGPDPVAIAWSKTKHAQVKVGCEQCHGPGSKHVAAPSVDNILTFPNVTRSAVCGQCHGPIADQYEKSSHAKVVSDVVQLAPTNPALYGRTCFRCHSVPFRTQMVDNKLAYGQTRDRVDADITAIGTDAIVAIAHATHESASCVSCHDPHRQTGNLSHKGKELQLRRAVLNTDTADVAPGTPPKQHTTFNQVCAACHNGRGGNPADAALHTGTARPNFHYSNQYNMLMGITGVEGAGGPVKRNTAHATAPGQCTHCHMPDSRHTMTVSYDSGCMPCHTTADAAARTQSTKTQIEQGLLTLRSRLRAWAQQAFGDPDLWDYTALIPAGKTAPPQAQIPIEVKRARHNYWFVLRDKSFGVHNGPYARHLLETANANLNELGIVPLSRAADLSPSQRRAILEADLQRLRNSHRLGE